MLAVTYIDFFAGENIYYFYTFIFVTYFSGISYTLSYTIYRLKQFGTSSELKSQIRVRYLIIYLLMFPLYLEMIVKFNYEAYR